MSGKRVDLQASIKSSKGVERLGRTLKKSPSGGLRPSVRRNRGESANYIESKVIDSVDPIDIVGLSGEFLVIKDNLRHIAKHIAQERATRAIKLKYGIYAKSFTVLLSCAYYSECTGLFPTWYAIQALSAPYVSYDNNTEAYQLIHKLIKLGYMERIKKGVGIKKSKSLYAVTLSGRAIIQDYFILYKACVEVFIRDYMQK